MTTGVFFPVLEGFVAFPFLAHEIKNYWRDQTNTLGFFGQKSNWFFSTSLALHFQAAGRPVEPPRRLKTTLFEKGVKDRKINVETPASFRH